MSAHRAAATGGSRRVSVHGQSPPHYHGIERDLGHMAESATVPKRVLVVDDVPEIATMVRNTLSRLRGIALDVTTEANAERAQELATQEAYDLVISDYRMKEANGLQVLSAARTRHPQGLRILMTGYHEIPATSQDIQRASVDSYLSKPIQTQELLLILSSMLAGDEKALARQRALARETERTTLTLGA